MTVQDFKKLAVWEKAHRLTLAIYEATGSFPKQELYGLTSQMRRSAASIPANIAEGCGREGGAEFNRFLKIASGSASELEYHILLSRDLKSLTQPIHQQLTNQIAEIKRMLTALIKTVKRRQPKTKRQEPKTDN